MDLRIKAYGYTRKNTVCNAKEDNYNLGMYSAWYQGNEEGIKKGKIDTQIATAKNFLAMKLTPEQVAAGTGLSLEEVLALMKKQ